MERLGTAMLAIGILVGACDDDETDEAIVPEAEVFDVTLTPDEEVPECDEAGFLATGAAIVAISADGSTITVRDFTFGELSGPATAAHIHVAPPGEAGPIVFTFANLTPPILENFTAADYPSPPPTGAAADFAGFVRQMREGQTYLNVHTAACPAGEIRAQIE